MLTPEQIKLEDNRRILPKKPASWRGHKFLKISNVLSGGTISESFYECACGATALVRVNLAGPRERHIYEYSEILFDCPLAGAQ